MAVTTSSSATIRGKKYERWDSFVAAASATGYTNSGGTGGTGSITKGKTYYFYSYATDSSTGKPMAYPYSISSSKSTSGIIAWFKEEAFPYHGYTITYYPNGGVNPPSAQTKIHGTTLTLSSTKPTRPGYTFLGWSTSASATTATYTAGGSYTANAAASLYAVWQANNVTITYNPEGGSVSPTSATWTYGTLYSNLPTPTKQGYNFDGWAYKLSDSNAINLGNKYMYTNKFSIHVEAYMPQWSMPVNTPLISCTQSGGWSIYSDSSGDGYVRFIAWDKSAGAYKSIISNIKWASLSGWNSFDLVFTGSTITGYVNGQSVGTSSTFSGSTVSYYKDGGNSIFIGAEAGDNQTTPAGPYFTGQIRNVVITNDSSRITNASNSHVAPTSNATLYATWTPKTYNVSFDCTDYENLAIPPQTVIYKTAYGTLPTPEWTGHTFLGWFTEKEGGTQITSTYVHEIDSDRVLYAHWKTNSYKIEYDSNPPTGETASGSMAYSAVFYGDSTQLRENAYKIAGYHFIGWHAHRKSDNLWYYVNQNNNDDRAWFEKGKETSGYVLYTYRDKSTTSKTSPVDNDVITMYAQWEINTYTVKYNANGGSGTMEDTIVTYGVSTQLRKNQFIKENNNYNFKYWHAHRTSDDLWYYSDNSDNRAWFKQGEETAGYSLFEYGDEHHTSKASPVHEDTITMYAQWEPKTYKVKYDANGGKGAPSEQTKVYGVNLILSSTIPTHDDLSLGFMGWGVSADSTVPAYEPGKEYVANKEITLYAIWGNKSSNCTIYARFQNTEGEFGDYRAVFTTSLQTGTPATWSYPEDEEYYGTETYTLVGGAIEVIYINIYRKVYHIAFNENGGRFAPKNANFYYGQQTMKIPMKRPTRSGYLFLGWSPDSSSSEAEYALGQAYNNTSPVENPLLYAIWSKKQGYTYFNRDGSLETIELIESNN